MTTDKSAEDLFKEWGIGVVGVITREDCAIPYCIPDVSFEQFQLSKGQIKQGLRRITILNKEGSMLVVPTEAIRKIILFVGDENLSYQTLWEANTWPSS